MPNPSTLSTKKQTNYVQASTLAIEKHTPSRLTLKPSPQRGKIHTPTLKGGQMVDSHNFSLHIKNICLILATEKNNIISLTETITTYAQISKHSETLVAVERERES